MPDYLYFVSSLHLDTGSHKTFKKLQGYGETSTK